MSQLDPFCVPTEEGIDDWAPAIALIWAPDWSDPREDIYTLEDGTPTDDAK